MKSADPEGPTLSASLLYRDALLRTARRPRQHRQSSHTLLAYRSMLDLQRTLRRAADGIATVLVRGESGTGKELVARRPVRQSALTSGSAAPKRS